MSKPPSSPNPAFGSEAFSRRALRVDENPMLHDDASKDGDGTLRYHRRC
jgi:hypothetical protein